MEGLQNDIQLLEEKNEDLDDRVQQLREREKRAAQSARQLQYNQEVLQDKAGFLEEEVHRKEGEVEAATELARHERRRKLEDSDSLHEQRKEIESKNQRKEREIELVDEIIDVWRHPEIDPDKLKNGDRSDFIYDFLEADKEDLNDAAKKKQKEIQKKLIQEEGPQ